MSRLIKRLFFLAVLAVVGSLAVVAARQLYSDIARSATLSAPSVALKIREVVKLETLTVTVYKKLSFSPPPGPPQGTWNTVWQWLRHTVNKPHGKAIVFADLHLSIDLSQVGEDGLAIRGGQVWLQLPEPSVHVELRPAETEIIGSNLNSEETAQLLEHAREAFAREASQDERLKRQAIRSARRAVELLLLRLGFTAVHFEAPPADAMGA